MPDNGQFSAHQVKTCAWYLDGIPKILFSIQTSCVLSTDYVFLEVGNCPQTISELSTIIQCCSNVHLQSDILEIVYKVPVLNFKNY